MKLAAMLLGLATLASCQTAEEAFVGDRLMTLCDESYLICRVSAGCVLDKDHYVEGVFPGTRRVVFVTDEPETVVRARIFFSTMEAPGTELLAQLYEPNCTLNADMAREHYEDVDLFDEAGDDRTIYLEFETLSEGEHLLEIYSDSSAEYLIVVDEI